VAEGVTYDRARQTLSWPGGRLEAVPALVSADGSLFRIVDQAGSRSAGG
jgi:hypothetical protein